jgi:hypothetical protein
MGGFKPMAETLEKDLAPGGGGNGEVPVLPTDFEGPDDSDNRREAVRKMIEEMHRTRYGPGKHAAYLGEPARAKNRKLPSNATGAILRSLQSADFMQSDN